MSLRDHWHFPKLVNYSLNDMRLKHASPRALPVLYNCSFLFWDRATLLHACICNSNDSAWFSAGRTNSTHTILSREVMSWSVVIINMNWCGVSAKKSFCIYQSATWLGRNRILVVLWTTRFLSKVKLCKSCLNTCNFFSI